MKHRITKILSIVLCLLVLVGTIPTELPHAHGLDLHDHASEAKGHAEDDHAHEEEEHLTLLDICNNVIGFLLSGLSTPVHADYEDGVECDYCGAWRYDDWKCDNGDHCGEGSDGSCYEEHHCGYCGACEEDNELCDDCGNCLDECCECDEKCRGCYNVGDAVCSECGEKCVSCAAWICDDCGKCPDCVGDESYCSVCNICLNCAEWICYCGNGCSRCALGCPDCYEVCTNCEPEKMCLNCSYCIDCMGGEGSFCKTCQLCVDCVEAVCYCGQGCSECTYVCSECGEKCENCADGEVCIECGTCKDCVGGEGSFCDTCSICENCVEQICYCGGGCSNCTIICPDCGEKCENCADDQLCGGCEICFDCVGGEGNYCAECGECKNCVDYICACGNGCSQCAVMCLECGEKCEACAEDELCEGCGMCMDCAGGEGAFCEECGLCADCAEAMCEDCLWCINCAEAFCDDCGYYCSDCAMICPDCGVCENCTTICEDCDLCEDCCAEASEDFGCGHGVCMGSSEWRSHYCAAGDHCVEDSSEMEYDKNTHWTVCGDGCDVRLDEGAHLFGDGEVVKEATDKEEGTMILPCKVCDYEKEVSIPKTTSKHTHEYEKVMTAPTCTERGYTTHTCSCGHSWTDGETDAVGHDYEYKYTSSEHWTECTYCGAKETSSAHKLGEWKTAKKPGYTYVGVRQRECRHCGYVLAEEIPMLTVPEDKVVITIPDYPIITDNPSISVGDPDDTNDDPSGDSSRPDTSGGNTDPEGGYTPNTTTTTTTKELLTKGKDNTVPTLPTLPPKEEGNVFEGWVDKATGEPVKKGDKLSGSIELLPVWKDCGKGSHTDADVDEICDECGYVLANELSPDEVKDPENESETNDPADDPADGDDDADGKSASTAIVVAVSSGAALVGLGAILLILRNRKKEDKEENEDPA